MRLRTVSVVLIAGVALVAPAAAHADHRTFRDPNDASGRLDIRSVSHAHKGSRVVHRLTTYGAWSNTVLGGENSVVFAIDLNNSWRRAERFMVVFSEGGRLRAALVTGGGNFLSWLSVSRPSSRSVRVSVARKRLTPGYRWFAATYDGASDIAPNRRSYLHDLTAPDVRLTVPAVPASLDADVMLSVSDRGMSGVERWRLQKRGLSGGTWSTVASGTSSASQRSVTVSGASGESYEVRLVAEDRGGNESILKRLLSFPLDDRDPSLIYSGGWTQEDSVPGAFLGTLTRADFGGAGQTVTRAFTGSYVGIVGPLSCGNASVWIDGTFVGSTGNACDTDVRVIQFSRTVPFGAHTLVLQAESADFRLDGIIIR